jgi:hypothetical protein
MLTPMRPATVTSRDGDTTDGDIADGDIADGDIVGERTDASFRPARRSVNTRLS